MAEDIEHHVGVGLPGIVCRQIERGRFFAEKPRLSETCGERSIIRSVGLEPECKVLGIAERDRPPRGLVKETVSREVVEAYTDRGDKGISAPST